MRKLIRSTITVICIVLLSACGDLKVKSSSSNANISSTSSSPDVVATKYLVTFITNGGIAVAPLNTNLIEVAPVTTKENNAFEGWYLDSELTIKVAFPYNVTSTITLYAKWEAIATEGLVYELQTETDTYGVIGYIGSSSIVNIPSIYEGKAVDAIKENAFEGKNNIIEINVPNSINTIGLGAFTGSSSLKRITLPFVGNQKGDEQTIESLFGYIFGTADYFGSTGTKQFCHGYGFAIYYIPNSLQEVIITDETIIGYGAFTGCGNLTKISLPLSVTKIGVGAFSSCSNLISLSIPLSVEIIEYGAFSGCDNLTYNEYENLKYLGNVQNPYFVLIGTVDNTKTTYNISKHTKFVASLSFNDCKNLTELIIPNNVTSIAYHAFYECNNLTSLTIPFVGNRLNGSSKTHFGYIFGAESYQDWVDYPSLKTVIVTGGNNIASRAFYYWENLISITLASTITSIGNNSFESCTSLTNINIPEAVISIGQAAFTKCSNLTKIIIPMNVVNIGEATFYGCIKLTIYCKISSQPSEWHAGWNFQNRPVVWGYEGR